MNYPRIVDARQAGFGSVQHQEGGQVGGVRGYDDHGESRPDHPKDPGGEAPRRSLPDPGIEEDTPGEPDGRGEIEGVLLRALRVGQSVASEWREPVQEVEDQGHDMDGHHDEDPESVPEGLQEGDERGGFGLLGISRDR